MVHSTYKLFLALYLAHVLGDFIFRSDRFVTAKKVGRWRSYLVHGITQFGTILVIVLVMNPGLLRRWAFPLVVLALCLVHVLLDFAKHALAKARWIRGDVWNFTVDQALHLLTVLAAAVLITRPPWQSLTVYLQRVQSAQDKILLVAVIYVVVVFGAGYFVRYVILPLWKENPGEPAQEHDEVVNAGLYIGWLERFLVLTAIVMQSPGTVGLIFAAKSIARYPELKSPGRFAEYFLIGTLLSISIAIVGGVILLKVFYGTVALGK
jgi:hypothetical protein